MNTLPLEILIHILDFATSTPLEYLRYLLVSQRLNSALIGIHELSFQSRSVQRRIEREAQERVLTDIAVGNLRVSGSQSAVDLVDRFEQFWKEELCVEMADVGVSTLRQMQSERDRLVWTRACVRLRREWGLLGDVTGDMCCFSGVYNLSLLFSYVFAVVLDMLFNNTWFWNPFFLLMVVMIVFAAWWDLLGSFVVLRSQRRLDEAGSPPGLRRFVLDAYKEWFGARRRAGSQILSEFVMLFLFFGGILFLRLHTFPPVLFVLIVELQLYFTISFPGGNCDILGVAVHSIHSFLFVLWYAGLVGWVSLLSVPVIWTVYIIKSWSRGLFPQSDCRVLAVVLSSLSIVLLPFVVTSPGFRKILETVFFVALIFGGLLLFILGTPNQATSLRWGLLCEASSVLFSIIRGSIL